MLSRCVLWHLNAWNCFCRVLASCKEEGYKYGYKIFRRLAGPVKGQPLFSVSILYICVDVCICIFRHFCAATGIVIAPVSRALVCPVLVCSLCAVQISANASRNAAAAAACWYPRTKSLSGHAVRILIWFGCLRRKYERGLWNRMV